MTDKYPLYTISLYTDRYRWELPDKDDEELKDRDFESMEEAMFALMELAKGKRLGSFEMHLMPDEYDSMFGILRGYVNDDGHLVIVARAV